ncbi:MAG: class I SAM-dependent methyltransferase [Magnetococcales bacterium]|nr:class I SAM-dependent methyltransferase [Magnetococcales bacterium]
MSPPICHVCQGQSLTAYPHAFHQVTSDCRPWSRGGRLYLCSNCGTVQKRPDEKWHKEVRQIYQGYEIYAQSDSHEQAIFQDSGSSQSRSERIMEGLCGMFGLPEKGRLLDIGCGNGALLKTLSSRKPDWELHGTEWSGRHQKSVEAIPGAKLFVTPEPYQLPGRFDLITLVHLFEHLPDPVTFLKRITTKLTADGLVLIQVPYWQESPFDLLVADHCSHFTPATLVWILRRAGFQCFHVTRDWVSKELSVVARPRKRAEVRTPNWTAKRGGKKPGIGHRNGLRNSPRVGDSGCDNNAPPPPTPSSIELAGIKQDLQARLTWLQESARALKKLGTADQAPAIFGTSIAATWLFQEGGSQAPFFVDEDPHQWGRTHLGRPILPPDRIPEGSAVFMAFSPHLAQPIVQRLQRPGVTFHLPIPLDPAP